METQVVKKTLHQLIDQIEDKELLTIYMCLLQRETQKTETRSSNGFFDTTEKDLVSRAKQSLKSIEEGRTRNIKDFKQEVDQCRQNKVML